MDVLNFDTVIELLLKLKDNEIEQLKLSFPESSESISKIENKISLGKKCIIIC